MNYDELRKQRELTAAVNAAVAKMLISTDKHELYLSKGEAEKRLFDLYAFKQKLFSKGGLT